MSTEKGRHATLRDYRYTLVYLCVVITVVLVLVILDLLSGIPNTPRCR